MQTDKIVSIRRFCGNELFVLRLAGLPEDLAAYNEKTGRIREDAACLISGKGIPALISDDQIYQNYLSELFI